MNHKPYNAYRRALAWIGFIAVFIAIPATVGIAIYAISQLGVVYYDRDEYLREHRTQYTPDPASTPIPNDERTATASASVSPLVFVVLHHHEITHSHI